MPFENINTIGVLAAVVANMVIGMVWYSPMVFGTHWMTLVGLTEKKMKDNSPAKAMSICLLLAVVIAIVLSSFLQRTTADTFVEGATQAFWVWLLVACVLVTHGMFQGQRPKLLFITVSHELVNFLIMGGILAIVH